MLGAESQTTSVGVMNAQGKVLIEPGQFVGITLDKSGRYLHARQDTSRLATTAFYYLNGKLLVPAKWQEVVVDIDGSANVLWPTDSEEFCAEPEDEEPTYSGQPGEPRPSLPTLQPAMRASIKGAIYRCTGATGSMHNRLRRLWVCTTVATTICRVPSAGIGWRLNDT